MPTDTFSVAASADDAYWNKEGLVSEWPPSGTVSAGSESSTTFGARKLKAAGSRTELQESFIRFDTSTIPDDAVISAATLQIQTTGVGSPTTRNLNVGYYAGTNWPITAADWSGADDAGSDAGVFALTVFGAGTQEDLTLTNVSSINKTGYTGFRLSISGAAPADDEDFRVDFATLDHTTLTEPQLLVTYTSASIPTLRTVRSNLRLT
jgi:hypothetical protein